MTGPASIPLLCVLALVLYLLYRSLIYPALLCPLSRLPAAHWSAPFSSLWILNERRSSRENRAIYAAHRKHGSIVRLGPREVSVNCVDGGIKTMAGFEKAEWYPNMFKNYG